MAFHRKLSITLMATIRKLPLHSLSTIPYSVIQHVCCDNRQQAHYMKEKHLNISQGQMVLVNEISSKSCYGTNEGVIIYVWTHPIDLLTPVYGG